MNIDIKDIMNNILKSVSKIDYIKPEDLPNIHLYMDQVTTFMDAQLESTKRHPADKILTKTMINNYTKNRLLPPPEKKKYSKEHLLLLIYIYYFKNILSISDIQTLLNPITDRYFSNQEGWDLQDVYSEVFSMEKGQIEHLQKDLVRCYNVSSQTFQQAPAEDRDYLQLFSFLCLLSFDVYVKKMLLEKIIDDISENNLKNPDMKKAEKKPDKKTDKK